MRAWPGSGTVCARSVAMADIRFSVLGPLAVTADGRPVTLGGSKQRALLALLVLHVNETLSTDRLVDELWGDRPPATATKTVRVHVSRLRRSLAVGDGAASGVVVTRKLGYELCVDAERVDATRFEELFAEGVRGLADSVPQRAEVALEQALSLWRGAPLSDLAHEPFALAHIGRLENLRLAALEALIEAKLACARYDEALARLDTLIAEHPYRERFRAQQMVALYRADRQAESLQAYRDACSALMSDLGIEPGERLRSLERAILAQ